MRLQVKRRIDHEVYITGFRKFLSEDYRLRPN